MRVMRIGPQSFGVSAGIEARWLIEAAESVQAVRDGRAAVPIVRFRTDTGVVGSIPVSDRLPVVFLDEEDPDGYMGAFTFLRAAGSQE